MAITVIDSIMGSHKTTWAINYMKQNPEKRFLYIAPLKSEDARIKAEIPHIYTPPDEDNKPKLPRVKMQLKKKRNIASTHQLFKLFDDECLEYVRRGNYTLIMDEVIEVINPIEIKKQDIALLTESGATTTEDYKMRWTDHFEDLSKKRGYGWLEDMVKLDKVINVNGEALMWQFPPEIFEAFNDVYVLTYMFEANIMSNYFAVNGFDYVKKSISKDTLVDYYEPDLTKYLDLINIYDGKLNTNLGQNMNSFSYSWYTKNSGGIYMKKLKNNLYNYFRHITKSKGQDTMWTCFIDWREQLKGKGYSGTFVSPGTRATNAYIDKSSLAYCINKFHNPIVKKYFYNMGYPVNEDLYALSDMLQWIWRSQIREDKPINIYVPSPRMRNLLVRWSASQGIESYDSIPH